MTPIDVVSLDDPRLEPYRTLQRPLDHRRAGIFVAEGGPVVERLLRSPLPVVSALVTPAWLERIGDLLRARPEDVPVHVAPARLLEAITGFEYHQGVLAVGRCPPERPLGEIVAAAPRPRVVVALDGVTWPENLGVIARTCAALEATALVAGERSASPFLRRAVRISMGGVLFVPVVHATDLAAALGSLARDHGFRVVAAEAHGATPLDRHAFGDDTCIVLGHEFTGLSPAVRAACQDAVTIPQSGPLDSLNVATAAAVLLYEVRRQRLASRVSGTP